MATSRNFVGSGWQYPFGFDPRTGGVLRDEGAGDRQQLNRIRDALQQIIGVEKGEMFMVRRFGSGMRRLLFAANDLTLRQMIEFGVNQAVDDEEYGERRIFIENIKIDTFADDRSRVDVRIRFQLRSSNVDGNLVFPLYLTTSERAAAERGFVST